jgi:hypothetical protein
MLGDVYDPQRLSDELARLPCQVNLPVPVEEFLEKVGRTPRDWDEQRRFSRFYNRGFALLAYEQTFPTLPRPAARFAVYTRDVSREGMGLLHSEQLFPRERMAIVMHDGVPRAFEVVWCRRVQERCYEIGARFVDAKPDPEQPSGRA